MRCSRSRWPNLIWALGVAGMGGPFDHVLVLEAGRIVAQGPASEVLEQTGPERRPDRRQIGDREEGVQPAMTLQAGRGGAAEHPAVRKVEPAKLKLLAFTSEHVEFVDGEEVCRQGDLGDAAYIVLEGDADVLVDTPHGPVKVATLGKNDIVGEIAILCDVPRTATVCAASRLVTLRISKDGFFNLRHPVPAGGRRDHARAGASRLHHTTQQLTELSSRLRRLEQAASS